jgi:hypothetical protein
MKILNINNGKVYQIDIKLIRKGYHEMWHPAQPLYLSLSLCSRMHDS